MLRNYFAAALRNLMRNRLHATLNILGLGAGFAAALLIALYVHHEMTFDQFLPNHEEVYRLSNEIVVAGPGSGGTDDTKGPIVEDLSRSHFRRSRRSARSFAAVTLRAASAASGGVTSNPASPRSSGPIRKSSMCCNFPR
jgi:hypothetical protein